MPRCLAVVVSIAACALGECRAQLPPTVETISFAVARAFERGAAVAGELRIPRSGDARLPAVVIVNSSPGFDGRGASYAAALNEASIATLEIDVMHGRGMPASHRDHMPHAYQSLEYLARHPRIDPARIGIMGFSWGGMVTLAAASESLTREHTGGKLRFASHLGVYPICWRQAAVLAGKDRHLKPAVFAQVTGAPVHILAAENDDFDPPGSCAGFIAALPAAARRHFSLTIFPGATFGWDSVSGSATYSAGAHGNKGGIVTIVADERIAERSREFAVEYFATTLAPDQKR
ncbi:MAG TPA: dienelactone hydrolase family protein [Usitatibacter sp.]|nr:dienelactone hydrolase family protein [Usitatibacter sp.]